MTARNRKFLILNCRLRCFFISSLFPTFQSAVIIEALICALQGHQRASVPYALLDCAGQRVGPPNTRTSDVFYAQLVLGMYVQKHVDTSHTHVHAQTAFSTSLKLHFCLLLLFFSSFSSHPELIYLVISQQRKCTGLNKSDYTPPCPDAVYLLYCWINKLAWWWLYHSIKVFQIFIILSIQHNIIIFIGYIVFVNSLKQCAVVQWYWLYAFRVQFWKHMIWRIIRVCWLQVARTIVLFHTSPGRLAKGWKRRSLTSKSITWEGMSRSGLN